MERDEITGEIIKIFYEVYNILGYGFLEKVYEKAMCLEFDKTGLKYVNQYPVKVFIRGISLVIMLWIF
ncbi:MAG: GxxExxY protein [archaeon]